MGYNCLANSFPVTERARNLRAQYALQANDLRARIERRVNRIPISLRKVTMGELLQKHSTQSQSTSPLRRHMPAKPSRPAANISIDEVISPTRDGRSRRARQDYLPLWPFSASANRPAVTMASTLTKRTPVRPMRCGTRSVAGRRLQRAVPRASCHKKCGPTTTASFPPSPSTHEHTRNRHSALRPKKAGPRTYRAPLPH